MHAHEVDAVSNMELQELLTRAVEDHRAGRLSQAEQGYERLLAERPREGCKGFTDRFHNG